MGTVLASIENMSGSQLTPSAAVYSQRNGQLEKLLRFRDLSGWRWDNFVVLEEAENQIEWKWHPNLAGGIMAHRLCYALLPC